MSSKSLLGIAIGLFVSLPYASSYNFNPWILIFEPQKKIISHVVTFNFQGAAKPGSVAPEKPTHGPLEDSYQNSPVPVEINISAREITLDGKVAYPNSIGADDFVVYPSQFILYPGDTKKVQVQWVGSQVPSREISYGFVATQLPLKFKEPKEKPTRAIAIVDVLTRYEGIIVVRPQNISPQVKVDSAYVQNDSAGTSMVLMLNNIGTAMQPLKRMSMTIVPYEKDGKINLGQKAQFTDVKLPSNTTQSLWPGFRRKIVIPWPASLPVTPISATVTFAGGNE